MGKSTLAATLVTQGFKVSKDAGNLVTFTRNRGKETITLSKQQLKEATV